MGGFRSGIGIWYAKQAASGFDNDWPELAELEASSQGGVMAGGIIPNNPYTGTNDIIASTVEVEDTNAGWVYDETTGRIWSAAAETQGSGF